MSKRASVVRNEPEAKGNILAQPEPEASGPQEITELNISVSSRGKAKVIKIVKGQIKDFIPENKIKFGRDDIEFLNRLLTSPAIQIHFMTEDGRHFRETFRITLTGNSKLRRYINKYGNPKVGQEVEFQEDSRGFPRLVLNLGQPKFFTFFPFPHDLSRLGARKR